MRREERKYRQDGVQWESERARARERKQVCVWERGRDESNIVYRHFRMFFTLNYHTFSEEKWYEQSTIFISVSFYLKHSRFLYRKILPKHAESFAIKSQQLGHRTDTDSWSWYILYKFTLSYIHFGCRWYVKIYMEICYTLRMLF